MSAATQERIEKANRTQLSKELSVDRSFVSQVLSGKMGISLEKGLRMARALGVTAEELGRYLESKQAVN